jgi:excisionase family DNA binding protein
MPRPRPDPEFRTPREVARMFGVTVATVARWRREGKLTSHRTPGGGHVYADEDIRAFTTRTEDE